MYGLDVNFLNDRPEYKPNAASRTKQRVAANPGDRRPLIFGAIAAVAFPAIALGLLFYLQNRNSDLEQQQASLDAQLSTIEAKRKEIGNVKEEIKKTQDETQALASVFNAIKPPSALMQDIRDRTPGSVQILTVKQAPPDAAAAPPPGAPAPNPNAPKPPGKFIISGIAGSFNDVNDFLLVLQKSSFLKAAETKLQNSELRDTPKLASLKLTDVPQTTVDDKQVPPLPKQVTFEIQTALSDTPASELLRELNRVGAVGQVTRIENLQNKGILQKP
jgi:type IV pilus assembly protein PilN